MLEGLETFANGNRGEQVKWLEIVVLSKGEQSEIVIKVCWDNFEGKPFWMNGWDSAVAAGAQIDSRLLDASAWLLKKATSEVLYTLILGIEDSAIWIPVL